MLDQLRLAPGGKVLAPGDPDYERLRQVFNAAVDRRPAAIVRPADASEVARAVSVARESGTELAVRGGGHSFAGHGVNEGGIVLDMSGMRELDLDLEARTAWAQAGLTAGEYTAAAGKVGLATGFGDTGTVGIAGITLGGGIGWLVRKHGLTLDDLLAVEMVGADGELLEVDAESHPDLFWALRGGGGNFGVVTRLRYRLHPLGEILGGTLVLPASRATLRGFVDAAIEAPEGLSMLGHLAPAPPLPMIPAEHHGELALMVMLAYAGDPEAGERALKPLRELAAPLADAVEAMPYPEIYTAGGEGPERAAVAVRTAFRDELDDDDLEAIFERMRGPRPAMGVTQVRALGGAMARVPADATAFAHRERRLMVTLGAMGQDPAEGDELEEWVEAYAFDLGLYGPGAYVNYLGREGGSRLREAYPGGAYERLAAVKARYDPENLFRGNHNIRPAD